MVKRLWKAIQGVLRTREALSFSPRREAQLFEAALKFVLTVEGGISNHPLDNGGLTNQGITQSAYDVWLMRRGRPIMSVRHMTDVERDCIYREEYWERSSCRELPPKVAVIHFDCAVNCGPGRANKILQTILAMEQVDGVIGPKTLARIAGADPDLLAVQYLMARKEYYKSLVEKLPRKYGPFYAGWLNRIDKLEREVENT